MIIIKGELMVGDIVDHIARLEALTADIERFTSGDVPTQAELDAAPLLDPWAFYERPVHCLVGGNLGHPILKGQTIRTSELHVIAPELGWARTYSRLYRLGQPVDPETQKRLLRDNRR